MKKIKNLGYNYLQGIRTNYSGTQINYPGTQVLKKSSNTRVPGKLILNIGHTTRGRNNLYL